MPASVECKTKTRAPYRGAKRSRVWMCRLENLPPRPLRRLKGPSPLSPLEGRGTASCVPTQDVSFTSPAPCRAR